MKMSIEVGGWTISEYELKPSNNNAYPDGLLLSNRNRYIQRLDNGTYKIEYEDAGVPITINESKLSIHCNHAFFDKTKAFISPAATEKIGHWNLVHPKWWTPLASQGYFPLKLHTVIIDFDVASILNIPDGIIALVVISENKSHALVIELLTNERAGEAESPYAIPIERIEG